MKILFLFFLSVTFLFSVSTNTVCSFPMVKLNTSINQSVWASDMGPPPSVSGLVCDNGSMSATDIYWQNGFVEWTGRILIDQVTQYYSLVDVCPSGTSVNLSNICSLPPPLSTYNGNHQECVNHGGWYADGKCTDKTGFYATLKQKRNDFYLGSMFKYGGSLVTAGGLIALVGGVASSPIIAGGLAGLALSGIYSHVGGALYVGYNHIPDAIQNSSDTSMLSDSQTVNGKKMKISLVNYTPSTSATPEPVTPQNATGKIVTQVDVATNKVEKAIYLPNTVVNQLADQTKVDFATDSRIEPVNMTGVKEYVYDYSNNTVTQTSYDSPSSTPSSMTRSTFAPYHRADGSTENKPLLSSSIPTISSSNGGEVVTPPTSPTDINTSSADPYSGDIVNQLSQANSKLDSIDEALNATGNASFAEPSAVTDLDGDTFTSFYSSSTTMVNNAVDQISSIGTLYTDTKTLLDGSWTPPVIPAGACGQSMAMDWQGQHVDLCPPLVGITQEFAPIVSTIATISGIAIAISIFIGGF